MGGGWPCCDLALSSGVSSLYHGLPRPQGWALPVWGMLPKGSGHMKPPTAGSRESSAGLGCSSQELFVTHLACLERCPQLACLQKPLILHTSGAVKSCQFSWILSDGNMVPIGTARALLLLQEKLLTCLSLCADTLSPWLCSMATWFNKLLFCGNYAWCTLLVQYLEEN